MFSDDARWKQFENGPGPCGMNVGTTCQVRMSGWTVGKLGNCDEGDLYGTPMGKTRSPDGTVLSHVILEVFNFLNPFFCFLS